MTDLRELYQEVILDHNKRPRNYGFLEPNNGAAEGYNPLCGDKVSVSVRTLDGVVVEIGFTGSGCAISQASASLMTEAVTGKSLVDVQRISEAFHQMVTTENIPTDSEIESLAPLAGVREFPIRVKCATLPWHTLIAALEHRGEVIDH